MCERANVTPGLATLIVGAGSAARDVTLPNVQEITPEVARILAGSKGTLRLDGISSISREVAAELIRHEGGGLSLCGLQHLEDDEAALLSQYPAKKYLRLDGITHLSAPAAESLSNRGNVSLEGIVELSPAVALALSQRKTSLSLDSVKTLSVDAASALSRCSGSLSLNGLEDISEEVAKALGSYKGSIELDGLATLSRNAAESLALNKTWVSLDGLSELDPNVAESLISASPSMSLSLKGLVTLSEELAGVLAHCGGDINLSGLRDLSPEAGELLSANQAEGKWLLLDGLRRISDETAVALHACRRSLQLRGISEMSLTVAKVLSLISSRGSRGGLFAAPTVDVGGLSYITDDAAREISLRAAGYFVLKGLGHSVSDKAVTGLRANESVQLPYWAKNGKP